VKAQCASSSAPKTAAHSQQTIFCLRPLMKISAAKMFAAAAIPSPQNISSRPLEADESWTFPKCARVAAGSPINKSASIAQFVVMMKNRSMIRPRRFARR